MQTARRRVIKARRESICLLCQLPIRPGDHIIKVGVWMHISHVLDRLTTAYSTGRTPP